MRTYSFLASRPGGYMNWPGRYLDAGAKPRVVAVLMFRRWFGREPSFSWQWEGNMAEATDDRGNRIEIQQYNHGFKEKPRPRKWLKHYRRSLRHGWHATAAMWHAKLLTIPALPAPLKEAA